MPINFTCRCGKQLKVDDKLAGKKGKCPACGAEVVVPVPPPPEPETMPQLEGEGEFELEEVTEEQWAGTPISDVKPSGTSSESSIVEPETRPLPEPATEPPSAHGLSLEERQPAGDGHVVQPGTGEDIPIEAPDEAAEAVPSGGFACPKCGATVESSAVFCVQCGTHFETGETAKSAQEKKKKKKKAGKSKPPKAAVRNKTGDNKKVLIIAAAAVLLLAAGGAGWYFLYGKGGGKVPTVRGKVARPRRRPKAPAQRSPGPPTAPAATPRQKPKPGPGSKPTTGRKAPAPKPLAWRGFADESLNARDRLAAVGAALIEYSRKNRRLPAAVADLGLDEKQIRGISLLASDVLAVNRFRPLAHTQPDEKGVLYAFFSDGTVRKLTRSELARCSPSREARGLTPADIDLLNQLAPAANVGNRRFASMDVKLDGRPVATIAFGASKRIPLTPGAHTIAFSANGTETGEVPFQARIGIVYDITLPRFQDLPVIPAKFYRRAFMGRSKKNMFYKVNRSGRTIRGLSCEFETVTFSGKGGRFAIPRSYLSLAGTIKREDHTLSGIDGESMLVSKIGRLEEGVLRHDSGLIVTYRKTPLGSVAISEQVNTAPVKLARLRTPPVSFETDKSPGVFTGPPGRGPGAGYDIMEYQGAPPAGPMRMRPGLDRRPSARGRGLPLGRMGPGGIGLPRMDMMGRGLRQGAAQPAELVVPDMNYRAQPDFQVLSTPLRNIARDATKLLIRQFSFARQRYQGETMGRGMFPRGTARRTSRRDMAAPGADREFGRFGMREQGMLRGIDPLILSGRLTPDNALPKPLAMEDALAMLSVFGDPSALQKLLAFKPSSGARISRRNRNTEAAGGEGDYLLALARCGGAAALANITLAESNNPVPAAIACAIIPDAAARRALHDALAQWSADDFQDAAEMWPDLAGPAARGLFVRTAAAAQPDGLDELRILNALLKIEPYVTEQVALAHFLSASKPQPAKDEKGAPDRRGGPRLPPGPGGPGGPGGPRGPGGGPLPGMPGEMPGGMPGFPGGPMPGMQLRRVSRVEAPPTWKLLARLKNRRAVERMLQILAGSDTQAKRRALDALAEAHDASLAGPAKNALEDKDLGVRVDAARLLAGLPDPAAVKAVAAAMKSRMADPDIARIVVKTAEAIGSDAPSALLAKMLREAAREKRGTNARHGSQAAPPHARPT